MTVLPDNLSFEVRLRITRPPDEPDREDLTVILEDGQEIPMIHVTDIHAFLNGCCWIEGFPAMYLADSFLAFAAVNQKRGQYWRERLGTIEPTPRAKPQAATVDLDISVDDILKGMKL